MPLWHLLRRGPQRSISLREGFAGCSWRDCEGDYCLGSWDLCASLSQVSGNFVPLIRQAVWNTFFGIAARNRLEACDRIYCFQASATLRVGKYRAFQGSRRRVGCFATPLLPSEPSGSRGHLPFVAPGALYAAESAIQRTNLYFCKAPRNDFGVIELQ
jgi:hypothetical protein